MAKLFVNRYRDMVTVLADKGKIVCMGSVYKNKMLELLNDVNTHRTLYSSIRQSHYMLDGFEHGHQAKIEQIDHG